MNIQIVLIVLLLIGIFLFIYSINVINIQDNNPTCTYDREASLQKARFDFANAYYNYPYDQKKVDFAFALKYARCN